MPATLLSADRNRQPFRYFRNFQQAQKAKLPKPPDGAPKPDLVVIQSAQDWTRLQGVRPFAPTIRGNSLNEDYVSVPVFLARGTLLVSRLINSVETGRTPAMVSAREAHRIVLELAIFRSRQTDHQRRRHRFLAGDADRCQCPIFLSGERTWQLLFTSMEIRRIG